MDNNIFNRNLLKGEIITELCRDIINIGFRIKHPSSLVHMKILDASELEEYDRGRLLSEGDINIYLLSLIFVKNDKNNIEDCGSHAWTLKYVLENKKDLQNLIVDLDKIRQSVKNNIKEKDIIDLYYKYERYLI